MLLNIKDWGKTVYTLKLKSNQAFMTATQMQVYTIWRLNSAWDLFFIYAYIVGVDL